MNFSEAFSKLTVKIEVNFDSDFYR